MALVQNRADSIPAGAVTVANSASPDAFTEVTVPAGSSITAASAAALNGALGFLFSGAASESPHVSWVDVSGATNAAAIRFYLRVPALPSAGERLCTWRSAGGGTGLGFLRLSSTGTLVIGSDVSATTDGTTTGTLAVNTIYRVELALTNSSTTTGAATLRVYAGDSTTPISGLSLDLTGLNFGTSTIGTARFGRPAGPAPASAFSWHGDSLAFQTGSSSFIGPDVPNTTPTANAGPDQANVEPWATVTLSGTASDPGGSIASHSWTQLFGCAVTLSGSGASRTFTAPASLTGCAMQFRYQATDNEGATASDTVTVTVLPVTERAVMSGGEVPMQIHTT